MGLVLTSRISGIYCGDQLRLKELDYDRQGTRLLPLVDHRSGCVSTASRS
jgi:hypothetical protein